MCCQHVNVIRIRPPIFQAHFIIVEVYSRGTEAISMEIGETINVSDMEEEEEEAMPYGLTTFIGHLVTITHN